MSFIGQYCVIRTRDAGVHMGTLRECTPTAAGAAVVLTSARRLWRWRGANSLHEVATVGVSKEWTRISTVVESILLTQAIEVIPCTTKARKTLDLDGVWGS